MTLELSNIREISFGTTQPFRKITKTITISSIYTIENVVPCPYTNPFELMFRVNWANNICTEGHLVSITYRPIFPNRVNYGYFDVIFNGPEKLILCVKGVSKGPEINCTLSKLTFHCSEKRPSVSKAVELVNMTNVPAEFHFDFENEGSDLTITPLYGTVEPAKNCRLLFLFTPKSRGLFYKRLVCLLKYQAPIIIEMYAISSKLPNKPELCKFIFFNQAMPKYPNNYENYLNDVVLKMVPESRPLVSIDRRFIDFGNFSINNETPFEEEFTVSNNSLNNLHIVWKIDKKKCFRIVPPMVTIQSGEKHTFTAKFLPKLPDYYYCEDLNGVIHWGPSSEFIIPFPLTVNLIGNTFQVGLCSWDPIFFLETEQIILPATAPNIPTYTTFNIYRTGHLPLLFKFVPPKLAHPVFDAEIESAELCNVLANCKSGKAPCIDGICYEFYQSLPQYWHLCVVSMFNCIFSKQQIPQSRFSIKPMQGLIVKNLQVCIVRLYPGVQADIGYVEKWELHFNISKKIMIKFCGSAELPTLKFGDSAHITFPPTAINTICPMPLRVRNPTRLHIRFSFKGKVDEDLVFGGLPEYQIAPNQQIEPLIHFYPRDEGIHSKTFLVELFYACNDGTEINNEIVLTVSGSCEKAMLIGTPEYVRLGEGLYSDWIYGKFFVYNPSVCTNYVALRFQPRGFENTFGESCINPSEFVLGSFKNQEITLGVVTNFPGLHYFKIVYILTKKIDFVVDEDREEHDLIFGDAYCKFPSLLVEDIRLVDEKINFSKYFFWEMLQINKINEALNELEDIHGWKTIYCKVPENEQDSKPLQIQFLFRNNCGVPIDLKAKCITSCDCKVVPIGGHGISGWEPICPHLNEIVFIHKEKKIEKSGSEVFQINILYKSTDKDNFQIELVIAALWKPEVRRNLRIHLERRCFKKVSPSADILIPYFDENTVITFDPLYIGDPSIILQAIWLYNNSGFDVPYEVIPNGNETTFYCVNQKDNILAFSMHPLLFRFTPYEMKLFKTDITIIIAEREFYLNLQGSGNSDFILKGYDLAKKVPLISKFPEERNISLSVDHVLIHPMPLHSVFKFAFFMRNNTEDSFYFHWKRKYLGGVYNLQVRPELGIINANELKMCQLQVYSLSVPVRITDFVNCVLINYTKVEKYVVRRKLFSRLLKFISEFFIYSDKYHRPDVFRCPPRKRAIPTLIKLGISLQTFDEARLVTANLTSQLKMLRNFAVGSALKDTILSINCQEFTVICKVFSKIFWDILKSTTFRKYLFKPKKDIYYLTLALHKRQTILPHIRMIQNVLNDCIYEGLIHLFSLDDKCAESFQKYLSLQDTEKPVCLLEELNNSYYKNILTKGMYKLETCLLKYDRMGRGIKKAKRTSLNIKQVYPEYTT